MTGRPIGRGCYRAWFEREVGASQDWPHVALRGRRGECGRDAITVSTRAIRGTDADYARLEGQLQRVVNRRDALAAGVQAQLEPIAGCDRAATVAGKGSGLGGDRVPDTAVLNQLAGEARDLLQSTRDMARQASGGRASVPSGAPIGRHWALLGAIGLHRLGYEYVCGLDTLRNWQETAPEAAKTRALRAPGRVLIRPCDPALSPPR